jgi:leucyl aminopeptidase (aminopeptidase T)
MESDTTTWNGARKIIDTCLGLSRGQELLILFDETTGDVAHVLLEAAFQIGVLATATYIPVSIQIRLGDGADLPLTTLSAMREAAGILTCVTDDSACLPFRVQVFALALDRRSRIGHMPGVTADILPLADVDYGQIGDDCNLLATALLKGERLTLTTVDALGRDHHLAVDIGGWDRPPTISSGLIQRGTWANIPAGETFIAPVEGTARGTLIVNGSLPGYVIPPGGEVRLEFEEGDLVDYHSADPRCLEILQGLEAFARERHDPNWRNLAEIGLGVNPKVELTGVELLDEKKYGTAHVALGGNDWFGGTVVSSIHSDLTTLDPVVEVDGLAVLAQGRIQATWTDWQEDHRRLAVDPAWRSSFSCICRSGVRGERSNGLLKREWISGRGDTQYLQVGAAESARKAAYLHAQIPPFEGRTEVASLLAHNADLAEDEVYQLLRLMQLYGLLDLAP